MSFAIERIDHVVLNCRDVDAVADWYVRVLGMRREVFSGDQAGTAVRRSEAQSATHRRAGLAHRCGGFPRIGGSVFHHHGVARRRRGRAARRRGGDHRGARPKNGALGPMTSYYCRDPEGNLVEIASYPEP